MSVNYLFLSGCFVLRKRFKPRMPCFDHFRDCFVVNCGLVMYVRLLGLLTENSWVQTRLLYFGIMTLGKLFTHMFLCHQSVQFSTGRVTTNLENLENLEYSGISTNMENSGEFCATSEKIYNKQNSFSSIKYLHNTTRSWASNEQSLVNLRDGHSALVTCYIAGVDVE